MKGHYIQWTEQELDLIRDNYPTKGTRWCVETLKKPLHAITYQANKMGLQVLKEVKARRFGDGVKARKAKEHERIEAIPHESYIVVDNPKTAYLLGLLWGDGSLDKQISRFGPILFYPALTMVREDAVFIESCLTDTPLGMTWAKYERQREHWKPICEYKVFDRVFGKFLVSKGYRQKSTKDIGAIIEYIPQQYRGYWLRGLIDADGHIGTKQMEICSTYEQDWTEHIKLLESLGLKRPRVYRTKSKRGHKSSSLVMGWKTDLEKIWALYSTFEQDGFGLPRKYEALKAIMNDGRLNKNFSDEVNKAFRSWKSRDDRPCESASCP